MNDKPGAIPRTEQVERARQLREAIENGKRGVPGPETPRSFTDQAAAKAARKAKFGKS